MTLVVPSNAMIPNKISMISCSLLEIQAVITGSIIIISWILLHFLLADNTSASIKRAAMPFCSSHCRPSFKPLFCPWAPPTPHMILRSKVHCAGCRGWRMGGKFTSASDRQELVLLYWLLLLDTYINSALRAFPLFIDLRQVFKKQEWKFPIYRKESRKYVGRVAGNMWRGWQQRLPSWSSELIREGGKLKSSLLPHCYPSYTDLCNTQIFNFRIIN